MLALKSARTLAVRSTRPQYTRGAYRRLFSSDPAQIRPRSTWVCIVPQRQAYVVERLGKFNRVMKPGLNFLGWPFSRIAYAHSMKEKAISIGSQTAITKDNVTIHIDGVLYVRVVDAEKASYGVEDWFYAVSQLAQTTMRSELGRLTLDKTFEERENLNASIVSSLNSACDSWGIECLRYEIRDITPPESVLLAMNMQAEAERRKRSQVTQSEGEQRSAVNIAGGQKSAAILEAEGQAASITKRAEATAIGIERLSKAIQSPAGQHAVSLRVAEQYTEAFSKLAKESTSVLLPSNVSDPSSFVASSLAIYDKITRSSTSRPVPIIDPEAAASSQSDPSAASSTSSAPTSSSSPSSADRLSDTIPSASSILAGGASGANLLSDSEAQTFFDQHSAAATSRLGDDDELFQPQPESAADDDVFVGKPEK